MVRQSLRDRIKNGERRVKRIGVDMTNRLERSFGTPVMQKVEIHYQGKPMTFNYVGPIETMSVDIVRNEFQSEIKEGDKEELPIKFEPTKKRMDVSDVNLECSCGYTFKKIVIPTVATDSHDSVIDYAVKKDKMVREHYTNNHVIKVTNVETLVELIPENERIKNFTPQRINFYRIFPKKTAEVRYLASYGQDLLAEAPQYKFTDTKQGERDIGLQNIMFMFFIFGLLEILTYMASSSQSTYYSPVAKPNLTPWYILIGVVILMIVVMWRLHINDLSKTMIKVIDLQSGPYYISNRGVLPVIMINSAVTPVLDFVSKVLQIESKDVKEVYYSLQSWSDQQTVLVERSKVIAQIELELSNIDVDLRDIVRRDHEYKKQNELTGEGMKYLFYGVVGTALGYTLILYFLGVF